MNNFVPQKIGMGFAFVSFGFLVFGSLLAGTTFVTAFIRAFEAAFVFGSISWWLGWVLIKNELHSLEKTQEDEFSNEDLSTRNT